MTPLVTKRRFIIIYTTLFIFFVVLTSIIISSASGCFDYSDLFRGIKHGAAISWGEFIGLIIYYMILIFFFTLLIVHSSCCCCSSSSSSYQQSNNDSNTNKSKKWWISSFVATILFITLIIVIPIYVFAPCIYAYGMWGEIKVDDIYISSDFCSKPSIICNEKKDIIIVGGGVAAISAARDLSLMNFNVTILEAKSRLGGRVYTNYSSGMEIGAQWIHSSFCNPLVDVADCYNIDTRLQSSYGTNEVYGSYPSDTTDDICYELMNTAQCKSFGHPDLSATMAYNEALNDYDFSTNQEQVCYDLYADGFSGEYGATENASVYLSGILTLPRYHRVFSIDPNHLYTDRIVPTGYSKLFDSLINEFHNVNIKLNNVVNKIETSSNKIIVTTDNNDIYEADGVLVTVSLGVLKSNKIQFQPSLTNRKQQAINNLGMGQNEKVWIEFDSFFIDGYDLRDPESSFNIIQSIPSEREGFNSVINLTPQLGRPVIMSYASNKMAKWIATVTDLQVVNAVMNVVQSKYTTVPNVFSYKVTRWATDSHVLGSYSFLSIYSSSDDMNELANPEMNNKVFFAGEATTLQYHQTVHGAYLSGKREAIRISETLC